MRRGVWILLVCIGGVIIDPAMICQAYTVEKLSKNGTSPSINDLGHVVWAAGDNVVFYDGSSSKVLQSIPYVNHPQINNKDQILWQACDYDSYEGKVFFFDGVTTRQLSDSYNAFSPHLSNRGQAVWEEFGRISFFDGLTTRNISENTYPNRNPQLNDKGQVVWEGFDGEDYEIFLFDGIEIRQVTSNSYNDADPQINGKGEIAWNAFDGNDWEIFHYDGANITQVTEDNYDDRYPILNDHGDIVWQGNVGNWQVFLCHAHTITQLSTYRENVSPRINNNGYVVWVNNGDMEDGIVVFDSADSSYDYLSTRSTDPEPQINDRGYLVWHDYGVFMAIPAPVTVLSPEGGEVFPSGSKQTVRWKTAEAGLIFKLLYSLDNGATWEPISAGVTGYSYEWTVPTPIRNRKKCLIKVIAYRAPSIKLGADKPDTPFSIEVVKLTKPDGWVYLHPGDTHVITWKTNVTRKPVDSMQLLFTRDGTSSPVVWEEIAKFGAGEYEAGYAWVVPNVQRSWRRVRLKLILRDRFGEVVGVDRSDYYYAIQPLAASDEWIGLTSSGAYMLKLSFDPIAPHVLYAAGFNGRFYRTSDGGKTWDDLNEGLEDLWIECLAVDPLNPGTLYVGDGRHKGIFKSTDYGQTWAPVAPLESYDSIVFNPGILSILIDPVNPSTLYAGTDSGVYKTIDGGVSWYPSSQGIPTWGPNGQSTTTVLTLTMHPAHTNILYAGTSHENGLFKSIDAGANWMLANTGMNDFAPTPAVFALAVDPSNPNVLYAGTGYPDGDGGTGVFKSSDGGETWFPASTGMNPWGTPYKILSLAVDPLVSNTLYAGSVYPGVFKSTDGGANWHPINRGLPRGKVLSLVLDPLDHHTVFAGHLGGVFKIHQSHGHIAVKPTSVDFGDVPVGEVRKKTITIINKGPRRLRLGSTSDPTDLFSISENTCGSGKVVVPGGTCKISVQFAPLATGSFTSSFTIDSDDPDNTSVAVTLAGASGTADANSTMNSLIPVSQKKAHGMRPEKEERE